MSRQAVYFLRHRYDISTGTALLATPHTRTIPPGSMTKHAKLGYKPRLTGARSAFRKDSLPLDVLLLASCLRSIRLG